MKRKITPRRIHSERLRGWVERSRTIGNVMLVLIGEYGVIMSLIGAFQSKTACYGGLEQEIREFCPVLLLSGLFRYAILFLAAYLSLRLLPILLEGLADLLESRKKRRKKSKTE